jgi:hypothetical protein
MPTQAHQVINMVQPDNPNVAGEQIAQRDAVLLVEVHQSALLLPLQSMAYGEIDHLFGILIGDGAFSTTKATLCIWIDQASNGLDATHTFLQQGTTKV